MICSLIVKILKKNKFHNREEIREYLKSEIERQGENVVIRNLDVSPIDYLGGLFVDIADGVKTLDLSGWDTSSVKNMSEMFFRCPAPYEVVGNKIVKK